MSNKNKFLHINPSKMRRPYGIGRQSMKVSMTEDVWLLMSRLGVIDLVEKRERGRTKYVAQRGGYGASFIQVAIELLASFLAVDRDERNTLWKRIIPILDKALEPGEETMDNFVQNLADFAFEMAERRGISIDLDVID